MGKVERTHKQKVEAAKQDAWRSRYEHINKNVATVSDGWKVAASMDSGLPSELPKDISPEASRAIVGLARRIEELVWEWS